MKKIILGAAIGFGAALVFPVAHSAPSVLDAYKQLDRFGDAFERVRANYLREPNDAELMNSAIGGMVSSLEFRSAFQTADEVAAATRQFAGIGLNITSEFTLTKVISPIDGGPAAAAGIKSGDFVAAVDGRSTRGVSTDKVIAMFRGPEASKVTLTILRKGEQKPLDFTLSRTIVRIESVKYERKGDIGYIGISSFNDKTDALVKEVVAALKREIGPTLKGYVLDLRDNSGGLLD